MTKIISNIIYTNDREVSLTFGEVIDALVFTGEKMLISNNVLTTQVSWAPDNMIEVVTVRNDTMEVQNHVFMEFNGINTLKILRSGVYKHSEFYYGYFED